MPGGANITTAAGDEAEFVEYASGDWRCTSYTKADGKSVAAAGKVLQVLQTVKTDTWSGGTSAWADVTGVSQAITPSNTSNKVLVRVVVPMSNTYTSGRAAFARLLRDSTVLAEGDAASNRSQAHGASKLTSYERLGMVVIEFLDSPATASEATYKLQASALGTGGDATVTASNGLNVAGNTQAVLADAGDLLELVSVSHTTGYRWEILVNTGSVALS